MKLVVGLGNPGRRYAGTRHNVGYAVVDSLMERPHASRLPARFPAEMGELREGPRRVWLVKPETFMNPGGPRVRGGLDFYQLPCAPMFWVADGPNLAPGAPGVSA